MNQIKSYPKKNKLPPKLFHESWKLVTDKGRQYWRYIPSPKLVATLRALKNKISPSEILSAHDNAFRYDKKVLHHTMDSIYRQSPKSLHRTPLAKQISFQKKYSNLGGKKSPASFSLISQIIKPLIKGWDYFFSLQTPEGHFPGDYGGPLFLMPNLALLSFITGYDFGEPQVTLMKRYILNHQNRDGGWGLHIEGDSTMFTTVVNYVALRIWGETSSRTDLARKWIRANGGAEEIPSWGKYYLAMLGLYYWEGIDSLSPESWLLPSSLIFSPHRFWCHARMVYLPLSYLYGVRFCPSRELQVNFLDELREEIFLEKYAHINWPRLRRRCCPRDEYYPLSKWFKWVATLLNVYERIHLPFIRRKALGVIAKIIDREDQQTDHINLGPINKVYNALVVFHRLHNDPSNPELKQSWVRHCDRLKDYLWVAEDGMKMNGYNGSQFWDCIFTGRALLSQPLPLIQQYRHPLKRIEQFVTYHRLSKGRGKGGWPFSTRDHSWPITDCSAEGLHFCCDWDNFLGRRTYPQLKEGVDFLLKMQNPDGGWPTYELQGGPAWLEGLNSSMVFGDIMVDYSYVECTSASVQALEKFRQFYPQYRSAEILTALIRGVEFIISKQRADGSWYGSWGMCFTYGTFFAVNGLPALDEKSYPPTLTTLVKEAVSRAVEFLLGKMNSDGSWGESPLSSSTKAYHSTSGQAVHTSWGLLSLIPLIKKKRVDDHQLDEITNAVNRGIEFLLRIQKPDGDWPQPHITGVFNHNCMITYSNYRNIFPLWALGAYLSYLSDSAP